MEDILKKLGSGTDISADEASLLWKECHFLELSSHIQELLTPIQRATAELWVELEFPPSLAPFVDFLLETYNKVHRPSAPGQDLSSWFQSIAITLPVCKDWQQSLQACRLWRDSEEDLPAIAFDIQDLKELAEISQQSISEILKIIRQKNIRELPTKSLPTCEQSEAGLSKYVWFELLHAVAGAGLKSNALIDLNMPWEDALKLLQMCRGLQTETGVFNRCVFTFEANAVSQQQLENSLKLLAISRSFLRNIPVFELRISPSIVPYVSLFSQLGIERISKTVSFPDDFAQSMQSPLQNLNLFRQLWTRVLAEVRHTRRTARAQVRYRYMETQLPKLGKETAIPLLLYKADQSETLAEAEAIQLAYQASIYSLGQCARSLYQQKQNWDISYQLTEALVFRQGKLDQNQLGHIDSKKLFDLDIASQELSVVASLRSIVDQLHAVKNQHPTFRFVFRGLKALMERAVAEQTKLSDFIDILRNSGMALAMSSTYESEQDLTDSELKKIHRAFHRRSIPTIAKVEIVVPYAGDEVPLWDRFCQRLSTFRDLEDTGQHLHGIGVGIAPGCRVNLGEYLRALALTRICFKNTPQILFHGTESEIDQLESWRQVLNEHPSLLVGYGIQSFGIFSKPGSIKFSEIERKLAVSTLKPRLTLVQ